MLKIYPNFNTLFMLFRILFLVFILSTSILSGQSSTLDNPSDSLLPVVRCSDFEVAGDGSNAEWNKADWVVLDQQNSVSPYKTRFKIMYSGKGIYCLYHCDDNKITATLKGENLDIYLEDVVEAFFWADEKVPVYFEYELSPLNYELVLMVPNYNGNFLGWIPWHYSGNRLTRHAVSIQPGKENESALVAWVGEFFIPFELMKPMVQVTPERGSRWRANFYRIDYDNAHAEWSWMPVQTTFHEYQRFGTIVFE
jgi:hypothetical protein